MATLLTYLALALLVAAVVFVLARYSFRRDEELAPPPAAPAPTPFPEHTVHGADLREVRFGHGVPGYRRSEVDRVLERAAEELDALHGDVRMLRSHVTALRARVAELERSR